ncbi:MAG: bi-domain-containing oxidoreductase [Sphingosinicella sp.]|uniref:bi-domain-containing oxidoreductase n=1 Tax=Sphingosinicella sp. TaxID=1917971 RepID=UPI0040379103
MKQVEQNYRTGALRVIDAPAPRASLFSALVRTRVSLISAGTEKQIADIAKASLVGKAIARPDLVRQAINKMRTEGLVPTARKIFAKLDTPIPLGYSLAGVVAEAGVNSGVSAGQRVACAGAGLANHAEFNAIPKNLMAPIPEAVSDEDASFVTVGAIALQGVRVADPTLGERVVVIGLGLIGLLTVQLLKANGCQVLGFDPNPARARLALELGADVAISEELATAVTGFTGGRGADAVIVAASTKSSEPLNQAATISRMKGRVVLVGQVGMTIDRDPFYKRELELRLSMSYGPGRYDTAYEIEGHDYPLPYVRWTEQRNMEAFLELIATGRVTPSLLVSHRYPIENSDQAYAMMDGDDPYLAILLTYPERQTKPVHAVDLRSPGASGVSGTAFVGFGGYAKAILFPALRRASAEPLRIVVTASGISAHGSAEKFGFERAATDPEEAFADAGVSTVFIATRHDSHAGLAVRALEAGKHVFVEKPLALSREDLDQVLDAARKAPGILAVGFNRRFAPMILEAGVILAKRTGPINMLYRINAGPIGRESWVHGSEGGGRILGEVCHFIDTLSALAATPPVAVEQMKPDGIGDSVSALIRFADGSVGVILYSSIGDPAIAKERIEIFGEGLAIEIDDFRAISISRGSRTKRRRAAQDKGQNALVRSFLAGRATGIPPVPLETLEAVSAATLLLAGR